MPLALTLLPPLLARQRESVQEVIQSHLGILSRIPHPARNSSGIACSTNASAWTSTSKKQNKTKQTKQNKTKQNKQNKTKQNKTKQNKTKQNKTKQNKTKQNKTKQNKTKQNKTKQKNKKNKTKQNKNETKLRQTKQNMKVFLSLFYCRYYILYSFYTLQIMYHTRATVERQNKARIIGSFFLMPLFDKGNVYHSLPMPTAFSLFFVVFGGI